MFPTEAKMRVCKLAHRKNRYEAENYEAVKHDMNDKTRKGK